MNVLFLSELLYPHGGGAELATSLYANLLSKSGFNVRVVTNRFTEEPETYKDKNRQLMVYRLHLFGGISNVKYSILRRIDILLSDFMRKQMKWADVVYVPRFWYSAILLAKMYTKPVVVHLHDYIPICPLSNLHEMRKNRVCSNRLGLLCSPRCIYSYENCKTVSLVSSLASTTLNATVGRSLGRLIALSDAVICVSKAQRDLITLRAPYIRNNAHVVYNPLPSLTWMKTFGDEFGYFGGPNYLKGYNVLCDALVKTKNPKIRVHATNFPTSVRLPHQHSLHQRIMCYDKLNDSLFRDLWKKIRAAIVPSIWHEPLPYVVSEAMLRGRILVASSVGGIPEQVEGCKGVWLSEPGNHEQLATSLDLVSDLSEGEAEELGVRNREAFLKHFDNNRTVKEFANICESLA